MAELGDSYPGPRAFAMGLNEACTRLAADISDQEVAVAFPRPPEPPENDLAVRHWRRHEVAVSQLDAAFSNGDLRLCLRLPDGSWFLLTSFEWHASAFHYEVMGGGVWRDSAGGLPQHNGLPVFLDEAAYYAWRRAKKAALKITEAPTKPAAVEVEPAADKAVSGTKAVPDTKVTGTAVRAPKYASKAEWADAIIATEKVVLSNMQGPVAVATHLHDRSIDDPDCPDHPAGVSYLVNLITKAKLFPKANRGKRRASKHSLDNK